MPQAMQHASKNIAQGRGLAPVLLRRAPQVELDWDQRQKSRFHTTASNGQRVGVFLPRGSLLRGGDVLLLQDGSLLRVVAAPQALLLITTCPQHGSPFDLMRAAYHLGNRHVPIELQPDHIKIEPDHVLAEMLRAMHLTVREVNEAFEPEGGAYGNAGHGHSHGHGSGGHAHPHAHEHPSDAGAAHEHGPACVHGHAHAHAHAHAHDSGHTSDPAQAPGAAQHPSPPSTLADSGATPAASQDGAPPPSPPAGTAQ